MSFYIFNNNGFTSPICYPMNYPYITTFPTQQFFALPQANQSQIIQVNHSPINESYYKNLQSYPTLATQLSIKKTESQRIRKKREKNLQRQTVSAKKNSQSNIINHYFSFFTSRECSQMIVKRIISPLSKNSQQRNKLFSIFYNAISFINQKRGRKYINKSMLLTYFTPQGLIELLSHQVAQLINSLHFISMIQIASLLRKSLFIFLKDVSLTSILTSKRISKHSKQIHLEKRRKIISYIQHNAEKQFLI